VHGAQQVPDGAATDGPLRSGIRHSMPPIPAIARLQTVALHRLTKRSQLTAMRNRVAAT
jgi:hypothetical protein